MKDFAPLFEGQQKNGEWIFNPGQVAHDLPSLFNSTLLYHAISFKLIGTLVHSFELARQFFCFVSFEHSLWD